MIIIAFSREREMASTGVDTYVSADKMDTDDLGKSTRYSGTAYKLSLQEGRGVPPYPTPRLLTVLARN